MALECGVVVFIVAVAAAAMASNQSLKLLTLCIKHTHQSCYQGRTLAWVLDLCLPCCLCYNTLACTAVGRAALGDRGATMTSVIIILQVQLGGGSVTLASSLSCACIDVRAAVWVHGGLLDCGGDDDWAAR